MVKVRLSEHGKEALRRFLKTQSNGKGSGLVAAFTEYIQGIECFDFDDCIVKIDLDAYYTRSGKAETFRIYPEYLIFSEVME